MKPSGFASCPEGLLYTPKVRFILPLTGEALFRFASQYEEVFNEALAAFALSENYENVNSLEVKDMIGYK